ncbi:MAG: UbiD family decarboxylase [Gammaproteobacteria bacterium]|nr:UbiD family decarboxylase [Gammaproteobacteria bacterium]
MKDLRTFLADQSAAVWELPGSVSLRYELTALQHALDTARRYPILVAHRVCSLDGQASLIPIVTNLTASRELTARALGIPDHRQTARWFAERTRVSIEPRIVNRAEARVQEIVLRGSEASLHALPILTQHEHEPGPYLTAAHATTFELDSGTDNTAIQRCYVFAERRMSWFPYPASHNAQNLKKFRARGERVPVAFWIGHHPAVLLGTQAKLNYPESHWAAAGGVLGEPLRLVPSIMHGEKIMVPADAEIVIEGFVAPDEFVDDGPFGEYTGYLGGKVRAPLVEVECITRRKDAMYHDYGSGLTDMLVPDNMAMEGKLYELVKSVAPSLVNVYVPAEGRRFHAYLQLHNSAPGEARDALAAALNYRRTKTVVAVDSNTDIFDIDSILWAIATRVRWDRDLLRLDGLVGSSLDPSLPEGVSSLTKLGINASGAVTASVATVPQAARRRALDWLNGARNNGWPQN